MGHGIALACLRSAGTHVTIVSRRPETVANGLELIMRGPFGLHKAIAKGKLTTDDAADMRSRLRGTTDYADGLQDVDLVFESIPETVPGKHEALREVELHAPPTAAIATNTSSIMIAELGAALSNPGRLVGTHWFYPANVMPLVEVVRGAQTAPDALASVVGFIESVGKRAIVVADAPGFFMTRFINTFIAEAIRLVELGVAGPLEVDEMVKTGLGWPMGVFELLDDTASFDSWYHAQEYLHQTCGERYAVPPLARRVFAAGYRGAPTLKPGSKGGWYDFLGITRPPRPK
jgi:3-hydroxybutyryl-CoA dehydrogenase